MNANKNLSISLSSCLETILSPGLKRYSYECEDKCPENQYFDAKDDTCKSRIR